MSSILEGLYEEEYEASEDSDLSRKLDKVESILGTRTDRNGRLYNEYVNDITKNIKYLQQDELVFELYSKMESMAKAIGLNAGGDGRSYRLGDAEDAVREAFNNLESAVYQMQEPFEEFVRDLQYKVEEEKLDAEEAEVDEGMYDQDAFNSIFGVDSKDRAKKREKPTKEEKPRHTGMYLPPHDKESDEEETLSEAQFDEAAGEKDACYHKVKSRYKVWPSAYASGALVKCRKVGASNWGKTTTKEDEDLDEAGTNCWKGYEKKGTKKMFGKTVNNCVKKESVEVVNEDLKAWFGKGKDGGAGGGGWDAYDGSGNRTGKCGDSEGEAKPKCLSKSKAASLRSSGGKKAIGAAVKKKRRNDPNKDRKGKAKNVSSKTNESNILKGLNESQIQSLRQLDEGIKEKLIGLGLAGALGLGALIMPSAEDSPLGLEMQAASEAGDAVAAYHLKNLDLYTDAGMSRTLVNLKIAYIDDSPREDVKAFLSDPKRFPALARK